MTTLMLGAHCDGFFSMGIPRVKSLLILCSISEWIFFVIISMFLEVSHAVGTVGMLLKLQCGSLVVLVYALKGPQLHCNLSLQFYTEP